MRRALVVLLPLALMLGLTACGSDGATSADASGGKDALEGVLALTAGACDGAEPTGSSFRMVQPGGSVESGPWVDNGDSPCAEKSVTPLAPGADGGLRLGAYQAQPDPPFGDDGASLSAAVIEPVTFFAVPFGISTNPTDPQTGKKVPAPVLNLDGTSVHGDLSALSVSWNGQHFNQGAPKPGGDGGVTGSYDPDTKHLSLDWTSAIQGGPFNGFTGVWHLEGTVRTD